LILETDYKFEEEYEVFNEKFVKTPREIALSLKAERDIAIGSL
jgi:hypothetical protein